MAGVRARNIGWRAALMVVIAGAAMATVLLWRQDPAWPGAIPAEEAARLNQLPRDLLLERCGENVFDFFTEGDLQSAVLQATRSDSIRLEATVWGAWDAPWQVRVYDREGAWYIGRVEITNFDAYSRPPPESGAPHVKPAPQVRLTETSISAETAARLQEEWRRSVGSAQDRQTFGRDGVSYFFRVDGACATTWSPQEGTRSAALTALLHAIGEGTDDARLQSLLDAIPPPPRSIPWPPGADSSD